ncbi:hypothetical protein ATANTOWER_027263, partial [Ataeniobius toweri]|nr:hypothetical protein [Ataeniobius toweri]
DTKRMEELFTRNQQMKEQHRLLTENIKTLENRLRAGLCDRCTVTQEVAKRRQQEYEASQIQSLQHISLLAGEMTNLRKENLKLKDDITNLRAMLDGSQGSWCLSPAVYGREAGYTLGRSPIHRRATQRHMQKDLNSATNCPTVQP